MRYLFIICFFYVANTIYGQSENEINLIIDESLMNYFNIQDSIRTKIGLTKDAERYVCSVGLPLGYDFNKKYSYKFHNGSYNAVKKLRNKHDDGIRSAYVFFNFQNEFFIVSIVDRYISYRKKKECKIHSSDTINFRYKYDSVTNRWKCVSRELFAL